MIKISRNVAGASTIGMITAVFLYEAFKFPFGSVREPGMGFFPVLVASTILILCILLIGKELLLYFHSVSSIDQDNNQWEGEEGSGSPDYRKPFMLILTLLLYPWAFAYLGFVLSSILLLYASFRIMEYRNWMISLAMTMLTVIAAIVVFIIGLNVRFPKGILW